MEIKKSHKEEVEKIVFEKDNEIVHSNEDILTENANLNEKNEALRTELKKIKQAQ